MPAAVSVGALGAAALLVAVTVAVPPPGYRVPAACLRRLAMVLRG